MKKSINLAAFALAAVLASTATGGMAGATPLADRAAALGGKPFTVEHEAAGQRPVSAERVTAENPLADRAAVLGGQAFTVKSAEGSRYHNVRQTDAAVDQIAGNPLAERAATLGGKAFTIEHDASQSPSFLARFN